MHALAFKQRSGSEQQSGGIFLFSKICSKEHTFSLREVFIVYWGRKVPDHMKLREKMIHVFYDAMQLNNFQAFSHFFNEIL